MVAVARLTKTPEAQAVLLLAVVAVERVALSIITILYLQRPLAGSVAFIPQAKREAVRPLVRLELLARLLSDEGREAAAVAMAMRLELAMLVAQAVRLEEAAAAAVVALR